MKSWQPCKSASKKVKFDPNDGPFFYRMIFTLHETAKQLNAQNEKKKEATIWRNNFDFYSKETNRQAEQSRVLLFVEKNLAL